MENSANSRYRLVIIPSLISGIGTNLYILIVLLLSGAANSIWSPIIGTLIFSLALYNLKTHSKNVKLIFLIIALTVSLEIVYHTYILGWNFGFFYYFILLPAVFLLNTSWKLWVIFAFNTLLILTVIVTFYFFSKVPGAHASNLDFSNIIYFVNASGTGMILFFILVYFSRTVYRKDQELVQANHELEKQNSEIHTQHEYSKILLQEIHHRVKNNLQIISSLMSLQSRSVENKEANKVLNESRRRVEAIALIHQKLYQDNKNNLVDFKSYLEEILASQKILTPNLDCQLRSDAIIISLDTAVPLGLIVSEIITNSVKHAFPGIEKPVLEIDLNKNGDDFQLIVSDNGVGLPEDFEIESSSSLGSEIIVALVSQINAEINCKNNPGAEYTIQFQDNIN